MDGQLNDVLKVAYWLVTSGLPWGTYQIDQLLFVLTEKA